jgi:hypothetical protein
MGLFDRSLKESQDAQRMAFTTLSAESQRAAAEIELQRTRISKGEQIIGEEFNKLESQIEDVATEAATLQHQVTQRIAEELRAQQERAERQEVVSTQLHANIGTTDAASLSRDQILEKELQDLRKLRKDDQQQIRQYLDRERKQLEEYLDKEREKNNHNFRMFDEREKAHQTQMAKMMEILEKNNTAPPPSRPDTTVDENRWRSTSES